MTAAAASTSSGPACSGATTRTAMPVSLRAPRSTAARSARVFSDGACATISSRLGMPRSTMIKKLLIANRGEIAIRIAEAAAELGVATVGIHSEDDANSLHLKRVGEVKALKGRGAAAYLDIAGVIAAAKAGTCDAIHPGYGFLSENAEFAKACAAAKITFVGPTPEQLKLFGDKAAARAHANKCKVPVLPGTDGAVDVAGAVAFFKKQAKSGIALKAIAGGGGRGMRLIRNEGEIADAFARASAEARSAFGNGALYAELLVNHARHIEVQIVGDGQGGI